MYLHTETREYPVTEDQIKERHPACYPIPFEPWDGYAFVQPSAPPDHNPGTHRAEETDPEQAGGEWVQRWSVVNLKAAELAELLAAEKARLMAAATAKRWEVETGGVTFPGGLRVNTTRDDQDSITRVLVNAQAAGISQVRFKASSGWINGLPMDELRQIANAIALHVQGCYDAEYAHHEAIEALTTLAQARAYDPIAYYPKRITG